MRRALAAIVIALLAGCGTTKPPEGIEVHDLAIDSRAVGREMPVKVIVPEGGADGRPLLVVLHGRGGDAGELPQGGGARVPAAPAVPGG